MSGDSRKRRAWMEGKADGIGLAQVLEDLRAELELARGKAAGTDVQFPVETVTVELKVGVTRSKEGRTGFRVPLVGAELGGSAGIDRDTLQTVTLVLGAPVDRFGDRVKVASASDKLRGAGGVGAAGRAGGGGDRRSRGVCEPSLLVWLGMHRDRADGVDRGARGRRRAHGASARSEQGAARSEGGRSVCGRRRRAAAGSGVWWSWRSRRSTCPV